MSPLNHERLLKWVLCSVASLTASLVVLVLFFLITESAELLSRFEPARFVTDGSWHPTEGRFDLSAMVIGTASTTVGAMLLAVPLGIASAVFRRVYAPPKLGHLYGRLIEIFAGIPSVVYGLWGLMVLVPLITQIQPPGASLLAGILILTLMILPTIALLADAAIANVPSSYLHGAEALGIRRGTMVRQVLLPAARPGLFTGSLLGAGRAIGETMAILMVCGNVVQVPDSLFDPVRTLTANIALEMGYALGDHRAVLFVSGLALMMMMVGLVLAAEWSTRGRLHG